MNDGAPPPTNITRVATWLSTHPGFHRPKTVAAGTGLTPHQAAVALRYMWECGRIDRKKVQREGYTQAYGIYGVDNGAVRPPDRVPAWRHAERGTAEVITLVQPPKEKP